MTVSAGVAERRILRGRGYQGIQKIKMRRSGGGAQGKEDMGMRGGEQREREREEEESCERGLLSRES